jgi:hypothetical protein
MAKAKTPEQDKDEASEGFDKPASRRNVKPVNNALVALAVILIVVGVLYATGVFDMFLGGGGIFGGARNCIASVLGNPADCSDYDGACKSTTVNGNPLGSCTGIDSSNHCIPC